MIITSIYSGIKLKSAFVRLDVTDDKKVVLTEVWNPIPQGESVFEAIEKQESDSVIFNGANIAGELHNPLYESAKLRNIKNSKIAKPFSESDGLAIFRDIEAKLIFSTACDDWNTLSVELNRLDQHRTGRAMAFLQAIIAADTEVNRRPLVFAFNVAYDKQSRYREGWRPLGGSPFSRF